MGAIAFADLDFLSDAELHVVKWSLKDITIKEMGRHLLGSSGDL